MTLNEFKAQVSAQWPNREIAFRDYTDSLEKWPWMPNYCADYWPSESQRVVADYKGTWLHKWRVSVSDCYGDDKHDFDGSGDTLADAVGALVNKAHRHIAPFTAVLEAVA